VVKDPLALYVIRAHCLALTGWLLDESARNIQTILLQQSVGPMLEIGTYRGQCAALMLSCLRPGELLYLNDLFVAPEDGAAGYAPREDQEAVAQFWKENPPLGITDLLEALEPFGDVSQIQARQGPSRTLADTIGDDVRFRFVHIDGSHARSDVLADLEYSAAHMQPNGVIALDDWCNPHWPEVREAMDVFVAANPAWHSCLGDAGKCYLGRRRPLET
jgi:hypothetical protein